MNNLVKLTIALIMLCVVCPLGANAFVVDSICYRMYYNMDRLEYEVGVEEHDSYHNYEMYVGDLSIPESVTYQGVTYRVSMITSSAFYASTYLRSVYIPKTVQFIDYGSNTFEYCISLESIWVDAENEAYCDIDGVLFTKDKSTLVAYPRGRQGEYNIPEGVQKIGVLAFYKRRKLSSVTLPESLKEIEVHAFLGCDSLKTVISHNPTPPALDWSPNDAYSNVFGQVKPDTLRVPRSAIEAYSNATEWCLFAHILPIAGDYDITGDGEVDVADVNLLINGMLQGGVPTWYDLNNDGQIDIADVNIGINNMLGK